MIKYYKYKDGDFLSINTETKHEYHERVCFDCRFTIIPHNPSSVTDSITFEDELHLYKEITLDDVPENFKKPLSI